MKRKEYIKPLTVTVRIVQRSCILVASEPSEESLDYDVDMEDYNLREEEEW